MTDATARPIVAPPGPVSEESRSAAGLDGSDRATGEDAGGERRTRFQAALAALATSSSADLTRWVMIPASIALLAGFNLMLFGWMGAARTAREIEQIPYLISGGLMGLGLVVVGGLLLASAFWVAVARRMASEAEARAQAQVVQLEARFEALTASAGAAVDAAAAAAASAAAAAAAVSEASTEVARPSPPPATSSRTASSRTASSRTANGSSGAPRARRSTTGGAATRGASRR